MLPLGDDNSQRRIVPVVTYALIALNVLVYFYEISQPDIETFLVTWGTVPALITAGEGYITLFTSMFLHDPFSWLHLLSNMLFLWIFGDNIEDAFGHAPYLLFYLACGVAASLAQVFATPDSTAPGVGASGAISGVMGAYLLMFGGNRMRVLIGPVLTTVPAFVMIGLWIVLQFVNGFGAVADNVAYWAHIGGFIAGIVGAFFLRMVIRRPELVRERRAAR